MIEPQTTPTPLTGPDAEAASAPPMPLSATPPVDVEALIAKAKAATPDPWSHVGFDYKDRQAVLSLCEEIKRLRASSVSPAVDDGVLREVLKPFAEAADQCEGLDAETAIAFFPCTVKSLRDARAALAKEQS